MNNLTEFKELISGTEKLALHWGKVTDTNEGLTVVSLTDDLEYFDVSMGLDGNVTVPKVGSRVIVGVLGKSALLLAAEDVISHSFKNEKYEFTLSDRGLSLSRGNESLKDVLNSWIDEVSKIVVVQGNTINLAAMAQIKQRLNALLN